MIFILLVKTIRSPSGENELMKCARSAIRSELRLGAVTLNLRQIVVHSIGGKRRGRVCSEVIRKEPVAWFTERAPGSIYELASIVRVAWEGLTTVIHERMSFRMPSRFLP